MGDVAIEVFGAEALSADFRRIEERASNMAAAFKLVAADFHSEERQRFAEAGPGWAKLAASTLAAKAAKGQGDAILVATKAMRASLQQSNAKGSITTIGPDQVMMGTRDPKAVWHQEGTDRMPARPVVFASSADELRWAVIIGSWLVGGTEAGIRATVAASVPAGPEGL